MSVVPTCTHLRQSGAHSPGQDLSSAVVSPTLTPLEPEGDMGHPMETLVPSLGYVGVEDGTAERFLLVPDDAEENRDDKRKVA